MAAASRLADAEATRTLAELRGTSHASLYQERICLLSHEFCNPRFTSHVACASLLLRKTDHTLRVGKHTYQKTALKGGHQKWPFSRVDYAEQDNSLRRFYPGRPVL